MTKRKTRKRVKIIFIILSFLCLILFSLNCGLTYLLEKRLKDRLAENISLATNGFYDFSFRDLSVGFFNGELSLKGLKLKPNPLVLARCKANDSLPNTYFDIEIEEISLKGINLTWRRDIKDLHFSSFEIAKPIIKVVDTQDPLRAHEVNKNKNTKNIYAIISPYINVVSIKEANLTDATISYIIKGIKSPTIYGLSNANFKASNFLLDKNSSESGKLLYCDDFEFVTNTPQQLLTSNYLTLSTNKMRLSSKDSIIGIEGIRLSPKLDKELKNTDYLDVQLATVEIKGIQFLREKKRNYLNAHSFTIFPGEIHYTMSKKDKQSNSETIKKSTSKDSILHSWSLYDIISPIFAQLTIKEIEVQKTKLNYTIVQNGYTDNYSMNEFMFEANNFRIDSLSEATNKFWYVDNFKLKASNMKGIVPSKNVDMCIDKLAVNSAERNFKLQGIKLEALKMGSKVDYITGSLDLFAIEGIYFNKGFEAQNIQIKDGRLSYFKVASKSGEIHEKKQNKTSFIDILYPYMNHLAIENLNLSNVSLSFHDEVGGNTYSLDKLNMKGSKFLLNDKTRRQSKFLFTCANFGLNFTNFNGNLAGKDYHLQIAKGELSVKEGNLALYDVSLTPHEKSLNTSLQLQIPLVEIKGADYKTYIVDKNINLTSLFVESPQIKVIKNSSSSTVHKLNPLTESTNLKNNFTPFFKHFSIDWITINNANIAYVDNVSGENTDATFDKLHLASFAWNANQKIYLGECLLQAPIVNYTQTKLPEIGVKNEKEAVKKPFQAIEKVLELGKFKMSDLQFSAVQPNRDIRMEIDELSLTNAKWDAQTSNPAIELNTILIGTPHFYLHAKQQEVKEEAANNKKPFNLYTLLSPYVGQLSLTKFDIVDAIVEYTKDENSIGKAIEQKLNKTQFGIDKLKIDIAAQKLEVEDVCFNTGAIQIPIMEDFYTMQIGGIDGSKKKNAYTISNIKMKSSYPKTEFAYKHPKHKDWFDISVGAISLFGVDYEQYLADKVLKLETVQIDTVILQNYKNQNIEIQHNVMPLIYEGLYKIPIPFAVGEAKVNSFSVIYEELTKGATLPGKIFFTDMNGKLTGLTNVNPLVDGYIHLAADGKLMGTGYFTANWLIPTHPSNDHFVLNAHLFPFNFRELNQLITPMAPVEVKSGILKDLTFSTDASSKGATIDMQFLYNDLEIAVFKKGEEGKSNKVASLFANKVLKTNNPNKEKDKPRTVHLSMERNSYHSTFNYFWQILQPAVVESVGISQAKQNKAKKFSITLSNLKNKFGKKVK